MEDSFLVAVAHDLASKCPGLRRVEFASRSHVTGACARLGRRNYSERWWQLKLRLLGLRVTPDPALFADVKLLFYIYARAAQAVRDRSRAADYADAWGRRKVLLTYPLVTIQLFRILDHWEEGARRICDRHAWYWPRLKTPAKLRSFDARWKLVVDEINVYRKHYDPMGPNVANRPWPYMPLEEVQLEAILGAG